MTNHSLTTLLHTPIHLLTWEQAKQVSEYWFSQLDSEDDLIFERAVLEMNLLNRHLHQLDPHKRLVMTRRQQ